MARRPTVQVKIERIDLHPEEMVTPDSPVIRGLSRAGFHTVRRARQNIADAGLIKTRRLYDSIEQEIDVRGLKATLSVGTRVRYARFLHEGTGNPPGVGRIYPRRAQALRFRPVAGGPFVFAKSVRGIKPTPFLTDALDALTTRDFEA